MPPLALPATPASPRTLGRAAGAPAGVALAIGALCTLGAVAVGADLLAGDRPVVVVDAGRLRVLPRHIGADARVVVAPLLRFGPAQSRVAADSAAEPALAPPSRRHPLGTDDRGRDVAARAVHSVRTALLVGVAATLVALLVGLIAGLGCAAGDRADVVILRGIDAAQSFPTLMLLLVLQAGFGESSPASPMAAMLRLGGLIGLTRFPEIARLVRAEAQRALRGPHVEAAVALGATPARVLLRHVLPFALGPALTAAAFVLGQAVLLEAGLGFLGLGVAAPTPSFGELLSQARRAGMAMNLLLPPIAAVVLLVSACQELADEARRRLSR